MSTKEENRADQTYLDLVKEILKNGNDKDDRTGVGVKSLFAKQMRFDLSDNKFPLLTIKKIAFPNIAEEVLFFIKGQTNSKILEEKGVNIWKKNGEKTDGDLGPVYGWQWNHFGADYKDCKTDYEGQGHNQLDEAIELLKNDPNSRRMLVSAWNPSDLKKMVLPPCHVMFQFYVNSGKLSCSMYQRSADVGLGLPYNIASYSLLTKLVAETVGLECEELIITTGDTHIYNNHLDQMKLISERVPRDQPKLFIKNKKSNIRDYTIDDFELVGYDPHGFVKMEMLL